MKPWACAKAVWGRLASGLCSLCAALRLSGTTMGETLRASPPRNTLFTGSQRVAERLALQLAGKASEAGVTASLNNTDT